MKFTGAGGAPLQVKEPRRIASRAFLYHQMAVNLVLMVAYFVDVNIGFKWARLTVKPLRVVRAGSSSANVA